MKVIFLDHDGVMVTSNQFGSRFTKQRKHRRKGMKSSDLDVNLRFDNFDRKAVSILNEIIQKTDAEIVVSSDWKKHSSLNEMKEFYKQQGVIKSPVSFTPDVNKTKLTQSLEDVRCVEIKEYLTDNNVESWVCVDDLNLFSLTNFVHCPRVSEGIKQTGVKDRILSFI